ncbi:MAG: PAS domain S-box protein [Oscillatoriales cyanobacterium C42_A2020_001]|nr:PAS domain S-box protein [Leptolyngbyaceae cyanobacterium C42_A2020_001]
MTLFSRQTLRHYGVALIAVALAWVLMALLDPWIDATQAPFLLFFSAILVSAWYGGFGAGLAATVLSAGLSLYFFVPPVHSYRLNWTNCFRLSLFALQGVFVSVLCQTQHNTRHRAEVTLRSLQASEASLLAAKQQTNDILESITDGFFAVDQQWRFTYMNRRSLDAAGRSREEVMGQCLWDVYPGLVGSIFEQQYRRAMTEQVPLNFEGQVVTGRWYDVHVYPSSDGLSVYFQDLSDLKRSEARFRRIFESNMIGINFAANDGRLLSANQAYLDLLGYTQEDILAGQLTWQVLTPPEYLPLDEQAAIEIRQTGVCTPFEKELIRKDGSRVPVIVGATMLENPDEGGICFVLDVSDRKRLEQQLRQHAANLNQANRAKDEFLSVLSHELRTPLNAILGWAKLLRQQRLDEQTSALALAAIERNAALQTRLVNDLLDIAHLLQNKLTLTISPLAVQVPLEAAIAALQPTIQEKRLSLSVAIVNDAGDLSYIVDSFELDGQPLPLRRSSDSTQRWLIAGDSKRLQQVFWNLLSNAIKFTSSGGEIEIRVSKVIEAEKSYVLVQIRDTGIGIDPELLSAMFDYFHQADSSITRRFGGLGLGLAIVRRLVELHHGSVWAESAGQGQGTTVFVKLPLLERKPGLIPRTEQNQPQPNASS